MQMGADGPEEVESPDKGPHLTLFKEIELNHPVDILGGMQILRDPKEGVQVPQRALAFLDIGLDQITRGPGADMAIIALLELGRDKFRAGALDHLITKPAAQFLDQPLVTGEAAALQERGADGEIFARQLDTFVDGARGMADLEAQIPQGIEHIFDDALGIGGLFVGPQEQQIEVREGSQRPSSIAADGQEGQTLALGGIASPEHVDGREVEQGPNHLIGDTRQETRGLDPACTAFQPFLGDHAAAKQGRF